MDKFVEKLKEQLEKASYEILLDGALISSAKKIIELQEAKKIVRQTAKEHGIGWIPCIERYPDTDSYILLSFSNFSVPLVGRYEEDDDGGAFYIGDEDVSCSSQDMFVNAWRPLPEPYREE